MTIFEVSHTYCHRDFLPVGRLPLVRDGESFRANWPVSFEMKIDNGRMPLGDISWLRHLPILHGRSLEILQPLLPTEWGLLPVHWKKGIGFALVIVGEEDCLDVAATWLVPGEVSFQTVFIPERVPTRPLPFLVPKLLGLFCTDGFKDLIERNNLSGMTFIPVWPSSAKELAPSA
jgi:hypothetical protein